MSRAVTRMQAIILAAVVIIAAIGGVAYYYLTLPKAPAEPILIGCVMSETGKYSAIAMWVKWGIEQWLEDVNARGGILGRPVKVIFYDDTSDPTTGVSLVERLCIVDKVSAVIGPYHASIVIPASVIAEKYHIPMIGPAATTDVIFERGFKYVFGGVSLISKGLQGLIEIFNYINKNYPPELHIKKIAFIYYDGEAPVAYRKGALEYLERYKPKYGYEWLVDEKYLLETKDFTPILAKVKAVNPDAFVAGSMAVDGMTIARQLKELGINCKLYFAFVGPNTPEWLETIGVKDSNYWIAACQWDPTFYEETCPGTKHLVEIFRKKTGKEPTTYVGWGYGAAEILEAGIRAAGSTDPEKIRDALAKLDMKCCMGPVKFDERGTNIYREFYPLTQVQNGKWVNVFTVDGRVVNLLYPAKPWAER